MRGAIMQPTYMPWLGYFAMIDEVDVFIFLDDVQLNKRSWQTRNRIKESDGKELMLSIPLKKSGRDETMICDALFSGKDWKKKHLNCIKYNYSKSDYYNEVYSLLEGIYSFDTDFLSLFTINMIDEICDYLGITTNRIISSSLDGIEGNKDELLVNICKKTDITTYLSAKGSAVYIEENSSGGAFTRFGIDLEYQNYEHPVYKQKGKDFLPYMGIVDVLFNCGSNSLGIIRSGVRKPFRSENVLSVG